MSAAISKMKAFWPGLAILFAAGCAANSGRPHLVRIAKPLFGGEALYTGAIGVHRGCVVTEGGGKRATILFDPDVTLVDGGTAIRDGLGVVIKFGERVRPGAATLRQNGRGWSLHDINAFYGVELPENCPQDEVVRLHDFKPVG